MIVSKIVSIQRIRIMKSYFMKVLSRHVGFKEDKGVFATIDINFHFNSSIVNKVKRSFLLMKVSPAQRSNPACVKCSYNYQEH